MDGQGTTWRRNIAENFNRLSRVHQRYRRQTTDGPSMTNSEHELEFTFAKNHKYTQTQINLRTVKWAQCDKTQLMEAIWEDVCVKAVER